MHTETHYVLLHDLTIPNSYAVALRQGDQITEVQRATGNLRVGLDVAPLSRASMARPDDGADRVTWQDYAVVRGVPYSEAVNLDLADLRERADAEPEPAPQVEAGAMPAEADRKAVWVDYAAARMLTLGRDFTPDTARDRAQTATKAALMAAFGPQATDADLEAFLADSDQQDGDAAEPEKVQG